ncbi:SAM-dependent methyltransferase [Cohnella lupini]|uniref:Putative S-adenosyl-L-methionine-dependent methyltransferase n=1 Tax=Cohnella lupini TaxID=1294267 RepID=A0A3D9INV5_9BACL|nr:SAM-dependent methyltransferase [Cohnella lupini]RED63189.1 putative S-adenosyl-L-methionine-dependent methyltransferase [Cohnella lupini]
MAQSEQTLYKFGESPLWELQRTYYEEQGIKAWQSGEVPQYITSNPIMAVAYAEIVFGMLQDRARAGFKAEPVTIVELGAGSGRLAFQIVKELRELMEFSGLSLPPFRYVMTDLAVSNIEYWQRNSSLRPYVEQGVLDFGVFDAVKDSELRLTQSGDIVRTGELGQPVLVIANYVFDSLPQELVYVEDNKLYECLVDLQFPEGTGAGLSVSETLGTVTLDYHYRRATELESESYPYRDVMELYQRQLEDSHVLFPEKGIDCLERLGRLSREGFVLLTADKGDHRLENWEFAEPPKIIHHGSFSLNANYHAMIVFFERKGAIASFASHHHNNLNVGSILMLPDPASYAHTRMAYRRFVERFGPDDFFNLKQWFDGQLPTMDLRQILSIWRLGGYDAEWFLQAGNRMSELFGNGTEAEMLDIRSGINLVWDTHYAMEDRYELALECGRILYQMEWYADALLFLERYAVGQTSEINVDILYTMAICSYEVGSDETGYARKVLAREPEHEGALSLLVLLEGES